jgi:hypothetical protein
MKTESHKSPRPRPSRRTGRRPAGEGERIFEGLAVSPGIAIGIAHVHEAGNVSVPEHTIPTSGVPPSRNRCAS